MLRFVCFVVTITGCIFAHDDVAMATDGGPRQNQWSSTCHVNCTASPFSCIPATPPIVFNSLSVSRALAEHFQSTFRALSEHFQSTFRALSEHVQSTFRAISGQFQGNFRAISGQFQGNFRALSDDAIRWLKTPMHWRFSIPLVPFQGDIRAVMRNLGIWLGLI